VVVTVQDTAPDSPADGELRQGDVLLSVAGRSLAVPDPRILLGEAIGEAEGGDGQLVFAVRRGGSTMKVTLNLPKLGAYSPSWPLNCDKSKAIIRATADFIVKAQQPDGSYKFGEARSERDGLNGCLAGLFLLSTGDAAYVPNVRRQVRPMAEAVAQRPTTSNWHLGYQGILLAEYYLRTGYGMGGTHEAAHRTMMILNHFDPTVYAYMMDDIIQYLKIWEPYYQHSVWLISGSPWQPGLLKVLEGLGKGGRPICAQLKAILETYDRFDSTRITRDGKELPEKIREAIAAWERKYGQIEVEGGAPNSEP
jgi:hypothetical protein